MECSLDDCGSGDVVRRFSSLSVAQGFASILPLMFMSLGGPLTGPEYRFAVSNSCVIFFLVELALSILVMVDAYRRDLPVLLWGFIAFTLPYIGVPIYLIYILAGGYTRFHIRKDPAAEEIKRKWEDTKTVMDEKRDAEKDGKKEEQAGKASVEDVPPYRRL